MPGVSRGRVMAWVRAAGAGRPPGSMPSVSQGRRWAGPSRRGREGGAGGPPDRLRGRPASPAVPGAYFTIVITIEVERSP